MHLAEGYLPELGAAAIEQWLQTHDGLGGITAIFLRCRHLALDIMPALSPARNGKKVDWLEHVTDEQYGV